MTFGRAHAAAVGLTAIVTGRVAITGWLWAGARDAVSTDEFLRVHQAFIWSGKPVLLPDTGWGPLYYYVYGATLSVVPDTLWTPRVVTLLCALACLLLLYRLCRRASGSALVALLATAAFACAPRALRLGATPLAEMLCLLCLLLTVVLLEEWITTGRRRTLVLAVLMAAAAAATRYETWALWPFLAAGLLLPRSAAGERGFRALVLAIPLAVMAVIVLHSWILRGDPLGPLTTYERHSAATFGAVGRCHALALLGLPVLDEVPAALPLALALPVLYLRRRVAPTGPVLLAAVACACSLLGLVLLARLPTQFPDRVALNVVAFLVPLMAFTFATLVPSTRWRAILGVAVLALLTVRGVVTAPRFPTPHPETMAAAYELRRLARSGALGPEQRVIAESREWEYTILYTISGQHEHLLLDSHFLVRRPSLFLDPRLAERLPEYRAGGVRWILVRTPAFVERVRAIFPIESEREVAGYRLFRLRWPSPASG
ncbi:MAG: glycosyltransferase family 39 protein [Deltaproteobacteria bacterium]|nr:glycosyltransferase family 39 protein [Deltaproteobacteria bacterium]